MAMSLNDSLMDGRKWIAVALVLSAAIIYMALTRSYRDCVSAYQEGARHDGSERIAIMTCHMKRT
ncbi:hypothetical protein D3C80_1973590 [compost metagenome]